VKYLTIYVTVNNTQYFDKNIISRLYMAVVMSTRLYDVLHYNE